MLESDLVPMHGHSRRNLRVPRADESLLADPPLPQALELASRNRDDLSRADVSLQGRSLQRMRAWSRDTVLQAAREYTSALAGSELPPVDADFVYVGGHQPSLFHTGVWVKNFALGELATRTGGVGLNLVIDNDISASKSLPVAAGDLEQPRIEHMAFDRDVPAQPWEERQVVDRDLFASFGARVGAAMQPWGIRPLIEEMWPDALSPVNGSNYLRDRLTAARSRLERRWGLFNLELPISRLCTLDPFLWFAGHIFAQLPRFRDVYNTALAEYRRLNKIRSRTHPVADLHESDGWLESPFWVWREHDNRRGRVMARQTAREVLLSDGAAVFARLRLTPDMDACCAVETLRELPQQGVRLRTRALTTTLFARLCLGDLFIHGIGGAKYDEMTDQIIERFFGLAAPAYLTMSATLHLPLGRSHNVEPADALRAEAMLRDLRFNADRHIAHDNSPATAALVAEKQRLIAEQHAAPQSGQTRRQRRQRSRTNFDRYRRLQAINAELATFAGATRQRLEDDLQTVRNQLDANAVLQNREYPFCLFPAEKLQRFMAKLWPEPSA